MPDTPETRLQEIRRDLDSLRQWLGIHENKSSPEYAKKSKQYWLMKCEYDYAVYIINKAQSDYVANTIESRDAN